MRMVIAGGTGSLGRRVVPFLKGAGYDVAVLTRSPRADLGCEQLRWDGRTVEGWADLLSGAIVLNLAGKLVDCRPTARNIELLTSSRVEPTRTLVAGARSLRVQPALWLQMSTLAIYGNAQDDVISEEHPPASGPPQMAGVARAWENAAIDAPADRAVTLRTGVVLDPLSPALRRLRALTRLGLGGRIGTGTQWVSWIHIDDFLAALRFIISNDTLHDVVHLTAPEPLRNAEMMRDLRRAYRRPWSLPSPAVAVKAGAVLLRTDPALALTGRRCVPAKLESQGFEFKYPDFATAIENLVARPSST
jgi:uncharacterized protein (TIGR01777 family)